MIKSSSVTVIDKSTYAEYIDLADTSNQPITKRTSGRLKNSDCIVAKLLTCVIADVYDLPFDFDFGHAAVYKTLQRRQFNVTCGSLTPFLLLTQYPDNSDVANKVNAWKAARSTAVYYAGVYFNDRNKHSSSNELNVDEISYVECALKAPPAGEIANNASNIMLRVWEEKQEKKQSVAAKILAGMQSADYNIMLRANDTVVDFFDNTVYNSKLHQSLWTPTVSYNYDDLQYCLSMEEKH